MKALLILLFPALVSAENIRFPADSGVVDVTKPPYSDHGDGRTDDTAALQRALDAHPSANAIIYLPDGTYVIRDTLRWPQGAHGGLHQKRTILQGQSRDGTVIRLADGTFTDPTEPRALVWTGSKPAQRFRNAIRNLTLDTGSGNPGAIGCRFIANNQGCLRDLRIVSGDGSGLVGLDMAFTDEIGPLLVKGLEVEGFDVGIKTFWQTASVTFEDVRLSNQNQLGWENHGQTIFVRRLHSRNAVTALKNVKDGPSRVLLVDSVLEGLPAAAEVPAIWNQKTLYVRNLETSGYARAIQHDDKGRGNIEGVAAARVGEWLSHGEAGPDPALELPVKETPPVVWDPPEKWSGPHRFGAKPDDDLDDTEALQQAVDSGATTIYLPNGRWNLDGEVILRGQVHRFLGTEARLHGSGSLRIADGDPSVVTVERLDLQGPTILHDTSRTLVLSSLLGGRYASTARASGELFIEDVVMDPFHFRPGQTVWARQLNQETDTQETPDVAKVLNDGATLWILGMKTEKPGTIIHTRGGGRTELLGAFVFNNSGTPVDPAFVLEDGAHTLAGAWLTRFGNTPHEIWIREDRGGSNFRVAEPESLLHSSSNW